MRPTAANEEGHSPGEIGRLIVLLLLLVFQSAVPLDLSASERIRTLVLGLSAALLICWWLFESSSVPQTLRAALSQAGCPAAILFSLWVIGSALHSGLPSLSHYEAYRHVAGVLLFVAIAGGYSPRSSRRCAYAANLALGAAAGVGLFVARQTGGRQLGGAFHDEQLLAAVLCAFLPLGVSLAFWDTCAGWRRLAGSIVAAALGATVLSQNRSAWLALIPTGLLLVWASASGRAGRSVTSPFRAAAVWLAAASLLAVIAGREPVVATWRRIQTLAVYGGENTYLWREERWRVAQRLIEEQPVLGWGVGTYPVQLARFDSNARSPRELLMNGVSLSENAHNSYLQLGAEVGIPGLALFVAIPLSIAAKLLGTFKQRCGPLVRALRIAALTALAAQAITALANPAWEFAQCSTFQWFLYGFASLLTRRGLNREDLPFLRPKAGA